MAGARRSCGAADSLHAIGLAERLCLLPRLEEIDVGDDP